MKINGQKLNDYMANKGVFAKDLCKRVNMNELTMKKILSVGGELDTKTASKIAYILEVKVQDLQEGGEVCEH